MLGMAGSALKKVPMYTCPEPMLLTLDGQSDGGSEMKKLLKRFFRRKPKAIVVTNYDEWLAMLDKELI